MALMSLPPEIFDQVVEQLGDAQDFDTLFACLTTNRKLAETAVFHLYKYEIICYSQIPTDADISVEILSFRIYHLLPEMIIGNLGRFRKEEKPMRKLLVLWRSIILSIIRKTFYPYYLYITSWEMKFLDRFLDYLCYTHGETLLL